MSESTTAPGCAKGVVRSQQQRSRADDDAPVDEDLDVQLPASPTSRTSRPPERGLAGHCSGAPVRSAALRWRGTDRPRRGGTDPAVDWDEARCDGGFPEEARSANAV